MSAVRYAFAQLNAIQREQAIRFAEANGKPDCVGLEFTLSEGGNVESLLDVRTKGRTNPVAAHQSPKSAGRTPGSRWTIDECADANGYFTIRSFDGTPNGDIHGQPIATVYTHANARLVVAEPESHDANRDCQAAIAEALAEAHRLNDAARETVFNPAVFQLLGSALVKARAAILKAEGGK